MGKSQETFWPMQNMLQICIHIYELHISWYTCIEAIIIYFETPKTFWLSKPNINRLQHAKTIQWVNHIYQCLSQYVFSQK